MRLYPARASEEAAGSTRAGSRRSSLRMIVLRALPPGCHLPALSSGLAIAPGRAVARPVATLGRGLFRRIGDLASLVEGRVPHVLARAVDLPLHPHAQQGERLDGSGIGPEARDLAVRPEAED